MADLKKLLKFKEDDKLAVYEAMSELSEKLDKLKALENFDPSTITHLKGEKGDEGKTPVKGVDYFTEEEAMTLVEVVEDVVEENFDDMERRLIARVEDIIPKKGQDYFDGLQGPQGEPGKNAEPETAESIASKLNAKKGLLSAAVLKDMPTVKDIFEQYSKMPKKDKLSWSSMFREDGNPFQYYQVSGSGPGASVAAWLLSGNSGTTAGTDFVGTTDNQDLVFKRNTFEVARFVDGGATVANFKLGGSSQGFISNSAGNTVLQSIVGGATNLVGSGSASLSLSTNAADFDQVDVNIFNQRSLRLQDTSGGQYVGLRAPGTVASSFTLTLPSTDSTGTQALVSNGSGTLSWQSVGGTFIGCFVYQTGVTALTTSWVSCAFAAESFDTDTMHSNVTNNTRITFTTAGKYLVGGIVASGANTVIGARVRLNGTTVLGAQVQGNSGAGERACVTTVYDAAASDYVELQGYASTQNSTGDYQTQFWAYKIG